MTETTCRTCREVHPVGDFCPDKRTRVAGYVALGKDLIREGKARREANLCRHGALPDLCDQPHPKETA